MQQSTAIYYLKYYFNNFPQVTFTNLLKQSIRLFTSTLYSLFRPILFYHILFYPILSHSILSYSILFYLILLYPILPIPCILYSNMLSHCHQQPLTPIVTPHQCHLRAGMTVERGRERYMQKYTQSETDTETENRSEIVAYQYKWSVGKPRKSNWKLLIILESIPQKSQPDARAWQEGRLWTAFQRGEKEGREGVGEDGRKAICCFSCVADGRGLARWMME